ncbi:GUN4 domain-containing protein [Mastigocladopsis repens]|uniref:GUN4 domain-containing protein n=1 Tax=Mastigocladopsis repens TaxID=221287 RepID=UPI00030D9987|nr:GUN4 domain-containing protein [Mastigocladopsis repens]
MTASLYLRQIEKAIKRAVKRDLFDIRIRTAIRPQDIRRSIAEERPQIVHFCGHGMKDGSLLLEDDGGNRKPVSPESLAALFRLHVDYVKCVLLNACYSAKSGEAISQYINYVIGMNQPIDDKAAIVFAQGFYDGLGYDNTNNQDVIQRAFDEGIVAIGLENLSQEQIPVLYTSTDELRIDYTQLQDLLKLGEWKKADLLTLAVMLKVSGREKEGWLNDKSINNFPCTDLCMIDQLWVKYSNGNFSFSVQKRIWESVEQDYSKFGYLVGWLKNKYIYYDHLTFSANAPQGHLPASLAVAISPLHHWNPLEAFSFQFYSTVSSLASRLRKCNCNTNSLKL